MHSVFHRAHPSSLFPYFARLQLPDAADGAAMAVHRRVEMVDQKEPEATLWGLLGGVVVCADRTLEQRRRARRPGLINKAGSNVAQEGQI